MLNLLKEFIISRMPNAYWAQVVENNWERFAQNSLTLPLLWLFLMQIFSMVDWSHLNFFSKFFTLIYLALVLIAHEVLRLTFINVVLVNPPTITDSINCIVELIKNLFEKLKKANAECSFVDRAVNGLKNVSKNLQPLSQQLNLSNIKEKFQNTTGNSIKPAGKDLKITANHPSDSGKASSSNKESGAEFLDKNSFSQLKNNPVQKGNPTNTLANLTNSSSNVEESRSRSKSKSDTGSLAKKNK